MGGAGGLVGFDLKDVASPWTGDLRAPAAPATCKTRHESQPRHGAAQQPIGCQGAARKFRREFLRMTRAWHRGAWHRDRDSSDQTSILADRPALPSATLPMVSAGRAERTLDSRS
jgi:hypothetical protein